MPESRGCAASKEVREGGWVLELCCKGSCYSLGRLKNSTGTRERAGGKELDLAAVALPANDNGSFINPMLFYTGLFFFLDLFVMYMSTL